MFANHHKPTGSKNGQHVETLRSIRIGDRVQNNRFGRGIVRGVSPEGALVVRFDTQKRSRLVYPTLLERSDR